jgi:hypothetical protein
MDSIKKLYVSLVFVVVSGVILISGCTSLPSAPAATPFSTQPTPVPSATITPLFTSIAPDQCNGWEFNPSTQHCVLDISTNRYSIVPLGHSMCQGKEFDTATQECVFDNGTDKYGLSPVGSGLCNGVYYNDTTSYCAKDEGKYESYSATEQWIPVPIGCRSCYQTAYNPNTQICVIGSGVVDSHPCEKNDEIYDCCGGMAYEYRLFRCCNGTVFDVSHFQCKHY